LDLPIISIEVPQGAATQFLAAQDGRLDRAAPRSEKILVVDDEKAIVEMLGEMLVLLGYNPSLCFSAREGLEKISETTFDLVMSDLRMPDIDGPAFYRMALARDSRLEHRFIFLTGDTVNEDTRTFLKASGKPFLAKPFRLAGIEDITRQALAGLAAGHDDISI
jgi:CheY-like chemotaxis protein